MLLRSFTADDALALGQALLDAARERGLAVTVDVRRGDQQAFHAALPGTSPDNDAWIERKVRTVRRFGRASWDVGQDLAAEGRTMEDKFLLDGTVFAAHGGAVPIEVEGVGPVGVATVSGLPQEEDHRLVTEVLRAFATR